MYLSYSSVGGLSNYVNTIIKAVGITTDNIVEPFPIFKVVSTMAASQRSSLFMISCKRLNYDPAVIDSNP
ncbi:hypothetical protein BSL78_10909 [Apostichopus japonicus]|uniref:Uncharacterized protein n=1 Tax=Stichopus japonicus TaxID=307972 RepID=A0A2G8KW22_STIJA|nr:hypothetical protein BSL78_10909 [Apostichopus japonicus]